jgi:hypothetical protein
LIITDETPEGSIKFSSSMIYESAMKPMDISSFSYSPEEMEVLFPPLSTFIIKNLGITEDEDQKILNFDGINYTKIKLEYIDSLPLAKNLFFTSTIND